jgi:NADH-quinone oxidoreductase subunit H
MQLALFFLAASARLFGMSALMVALFFGGYYSPFGGLLLERVLQEPLLGQLNSIGLSKSLLLQAEMVTWFVIKTYVFIFLAMLIRGTLPRLKPDQLMSFSWKFLIPLSLINIFIIAFLKAAWITPSQIFALGGLPLNPQYWVMYVWMVAVLFLTLVGFGHIFKRAAIPKLQLPKRMVTP